MWCPSYLSKIWSLLRITSEERGSNLELPFLQVYYLTWYSLDTFLTITFHSKDNDAYLGTIFFLCTFFLVPQLAKQTSPNMKQKSCTQLTFVTGVTVHWGYPHLVTDGQTLRHDIINRSIVFDNKVNPFLIICWMKTREKKPICIKEQLVVSQLVLLFVRQFLP